jgi:hypothetical protein
MAMLSEIARWFWLLPQLPAGNLLQPGTSSMASEVAEAQEIDLEGALSTMNLPGSAFAHLQKDSRDCRARLAWVTLSRPDGEGAQAVRLRSGTYFSPAFAVTKAPVRVAIPYPAPYETGRGSLTVLGADANLAMALTPAWHIPVNASIATQDVIWHPDAGCSKP